MYILTTTTKYEELTKYYSKSGDNYTLLIEGTDYTVGSTITGTVYEEPRYTKLYLRPLGSSGNFNQFPYTINGVNTIPQNDVSQNDVDLDAYTNTAGYTVRNRVRHDATSIDFNVPLMMGDELHNFFDYTKDVWFECLYFDESVWNFIIKKMYRSGTVKYHRYYVDEIDPNKNQYTNVQFNFIEE